MGKNKNISPIKILIGILLGVAVVYLGVVLFVDTSLMPIVQNRTDSTMKSQVHTFRSSLSIYSSDHNKSFPKTIKELIPNYLPSPLKLWFHGKYPHPETTDVLTLKFKELTDSGKFVYIYNPGTDNHGKVYIDCSHLDVNSKRWDEY